MNDFPLDLRSLMAGAMRKYADRPAVVADGRTWTYSELEEAANQLAHALVELGVAASTPVALMMSNSAEYVVADLAVLKLGAAKVPLNDMLSQDEACYILRDSEAVVALTTPSQIDAALAVLEAEADLRTVIAVGSPESDGVLAWERALAGRPSTAPAVEISPSDVGVVMYTGGTTGRPKGVVHRQRQLALNLLAHRIETEIRSDERLLLSSPLPHSAGFLLQTALTAGALTYVEKGFDARKVLEAIHMHGVSYLFMVPTMIYRLLDEAARGGWDHSSLRTILYGAAPISPERLAEGLDRFGPVFMQLYGQSEAPNFITRLPREAHVTDSAHAQRLRSCGQPTAMCEVRIVDEEGRDCPVGTEGEVVARTAFTMTGYHRLPDATAKTLRDGWLYTGDIGYLDEESYLYLLDRKNDMIISGGMNVYCSEVEAAVREVSGVGQVAVVGVPHPDWGEAVVAFIVPDTDTPLDEESVRAHCRGKLSAYKRPKAISQVEALPLTAYGKVDKLALRAAWPGWG
ncbi:MAG TPA: AMP-binding protein [Nocardioidaceae bacterium]|nr:AMP-binding protein [Nocardioidaceae bacterium]